jgi:hypothetical protein
MIPGATVQPGNQLVVGVVSDDLQFDLDGRGAGAPPGREHEQVAEEPAAMPA